MDNNLIKYIEYVDKVYDNKFVEISSLTLDVIYRSSKMQEIYDGIYQANSETPVEQSKFMVRFEQINHDVIEKNLPIRFLCLSHLINDQALLGHGVKHPIIIEQQIVGIFSIITPVKIFSFDSTRQNYAKHNLSITLNCDHVLSDVEQQILFLSSYGFTQGEIYEILRSDKNVSMHINSIDNVKYYYYALLKKFGADSFDAIINSIEELRNQQFIPKSLFKVNKIITVN